MSPHPALSPGEVADRLAIRELIDAYARCADRRDAAGQMALFTDDSHFVVYMDATLDEPTQELHGRDAPAPVFDHLNTYVTPTHFNGQSTVVLDGERATGESYCLRRLADRRAPPHGRLDRDTAVRGLTLLPTIRGSRPPSPTSQAVAVKHERWARLGCR